MAENEPLGVRVIGIQLETVRYDYGRKTRESICGKGGMLSWGEII
jgi:hypothetical protein